MDGPQQRPDAVEAGREARILTWNINGLKKVAASHGGVKNLLDQFNADIGVCEFVYKTWLNSQPDHDRIDRYESRVTERLRVLYAQSCCFAW